MVIMVMGGCSGLKVDGACTYTREVRSSYQCEAGGGMRHYKLDPDPQRLEPGE